MATPLFKHTITIWSPQGGDQELSTLAREAEQGDSYCSAYEVVTVDDPMTDPAFHEGAAEFFRVDEDEDDDEEYDHSRAKEDARNEFLDIDVSDGSIAVKLTRGQVNAWAGYELDGDQLDQLEEAIPNSSIPEAIATIAEQFRDETVDPLGEFLPYGRCDTCGAPCDFEGCPSNRDHQVAVDPTKENHA